MLLFFFPPDLRLWLCLTWLEPSPGMKEKKQTVKACFYPEYWSSFFPFVVITTQKLCFWLSGSLLLCASLSQSSVSRQRCVCGCVCVCFSALRNWFRNTFLTGRFLVSPSRWISQSARASSVSWGLWCLWPASLRPSCFPSNMWVWRYVRVKKK